MLKHVLVLDIVVFLILLDNRKYVKGSMHISDSQNNSIEMIQNQLQKKALLEKISITKMNNSVPPCEDNTFDKIEAEDWGNLESVHSKFMGSIHNLNDLAMDIDLTFSNISLMYRYAEEI